MKSTEEVTKLALKLLSGRSIMVKMAAISKIKSQPFFGDIVFNKQDTIKFRRPLSYHATITP